MNFTAKHIAVLVDGDVEGNMDQKVVAPAKIEEAGQGHIAFLANGKYEFYIYQNQPSILLVNREFIPRDKFLGTLIRVDDVYCAVSKLLAEFKKSKSIEEFLVSPQAFVDPSALISKNVNLGAGSFVGKHTVIGEGSYIYPQVYLGDNVTIGDNVVLYPGVKIYHDCEIHNNVVIHANTVIGSDGFGFSQNKNGGFDKIPQIGNVIIEDNVEIGSGCTIDRASIGSTIIRNGAKLDNQIQIAHSVEIGRNTVIAAQVGIAGSTKVGRNCQIGGQVGIVGHISIADNTRIQAQSGVASSVNEEGKKLYGTPAIDYQNYLKSYLHFKNLHTLVELVKENKKNPQ